MISRELLFNELFHNANEAILISSSEKGKLQYIEVNETACNLLGYSKEELLQLGPKDITALEYIDQYEDMKENIEKKENIMIQWGYRTKAGNSISVEINGRFIQSDHENFYLAIVRDVSQHKELEEELREKSEKLKYYQKMIKSAEETAGIFIGTIGLDGSIQEVNAVVCKGLGYSREELKKMNSFLDITHPVDLEKEKVFIKKMIRGELDSYHIDKRMIHKNGRFIWVHAICSLMKDQNGIPIGLLVHGYNITHRKILEEQLVKSYREYQRLIDFFPKAVYIVKSNKLVYINAAGKTLLRIQNDKEYKEKDFIQFIHPEDLEAFKKITFGVGQKETIPFSQYKMIRNDGDIIEVEVTSTPITYRQKETVLIIVRDITKANKSARHLRELNERLKLYIEEKDQLIIELRKFRHNYLNILYGMSGYIEEAGSTDLQNYFYSVLQDLESLKSNSLLSIQKVKNCDVRELLIEKLHEAKSKDIELQIHVQNDILIPEQLVLMKDLCKITKCYLDEAIALVKDTSKKKIVLGIFDDLEYICLFVEYPLEEKDFSLERQKEAITIGGKYNNILQNSFIENNKLIQELQIKKL